MVDNISKPFIFYSNTYAKANEVNADFDSLYVGLNTCINQVNINSTGITNLNNNKANKTGDASQTFQVANATDNSHAINKQTLKNMIGNSIENINGYVISKSSDTTILVSKGSCYDSTNSIIMKKDTSTTLTESASGAQTYYVYVFGRDTDSSVTLTLDANSTTPGYPSGYDKFRQIGYIKTDSEGKILLVVGYGSSYDSPSASNVIVESYNSGTEWYILYSNGWCEQGGVGTYTARQALTIELLRKYKDTNYGLLALPSRNSDTWSSVCSGWIIDEGSFKVTSGNGTNEGTGYPVAGQTFWWRTSGYIS